MDIPPDVSLPSAFHDIHVGVALHDPDSGAILDANERLGELYGYRVADIRATTLDEYIAPSTTVSKDEVRRGIRRAAEGDVQVLEWQIERVNNELRWVRVQFGSTHIGDERCVIAEVTDITEYWARERRLRLLSRVVRHNLRNKTTVLMGYADRIKQAIEDETLEDEIETVLDITMEVGTLSESVRQIEEIANSDATERSATELGPLVRSIVDDAREEYPDAELAIEVSESVWVIADKGVEYAIEHAIQNAIEHNDRAVPTVTVSVADDPDVERGVITVADNGPDIPDMEIDALDENTETDSTHHGTGVGLWVMRWCVDSLGGDLSFERNDPRGNVVTISLEKPDPNATRR